MTLAYRYGNTFSFCTDLFAFSAKNAFFPAVFTKKIKKSLFFLFFFRFRLSFFKIGVMFTVRVFAIRQERSHITFGICCENEVALLKKAPPETPSALRIEREYELEFGQIEADGKPDRIISGPMSPQPYLIPESRAVNRLIRVPFPHVPASSRARMPFVFAASQKRCGSCAMNRQSNMQNRSAARQLWRPRKPGLCMI